METEVCVKASRENSWRAVIDTQKLKVASPSEFGKVKKQHSRGRLSFFPSFFLFPFLFPSSEMSLQKQADQEMLLC